ncbi:fatty acid oxidation complex subunit alpha FadJ [Corallincola luteus]|uniref:Fatty acid oxidation complex subunit alpha FadJ n=1 Tax=Corallincola luteus TaxID=1775177 RepID=A0ABY2AKD1_9GAMM|nr:fatty acid oxidation complex subunit alpha FadJ [Corallincola luteus]TCI03044.1 fatty acid oxidation complex subunit alpha FadJ [Corallincola luteus]
MSEQNNAFTLSYRDDGIAVLTMDVVGDTMNTLKAEFGDEVNGVLDELEAKSDLQGVVLVSGKPDSFVAGADISMLDACSTAAEAETLSLQGHKVFDRLFALPVPVVAAIHGACLGGGLELALACHRRVCSDDDKTRLGVPEVQLGLLPGGGGTQRLPQLVGIAKSLDMMLTGKQLRPKQALKMGLVDEVVANTILLETAVKLVMKGKPKTIKPRLKGIEKLLERNPFGRKVLFDQARKKTLAKTRGNYPAAERILDCVEAGVADRRRGFATEAKHFGNLVQSAESQQLRNIFFATTEMKKESGVEGGEAAAIHKTAVLGGGLMGAGIANVTAMRAKLPVRIKDVAPAGISNALRYSYDRLLKQVKRRHLTKRQMENQMARLTGATDYSGFSDVDIVVEAVFEDLSLKHSMVKEVEANAKPNTVFASNTSSLPIAQIAEAAARPENVIGLHYFSPVEKMPLVEVIAHDKTSADTIATTVAFAKKQGKTPIVVKDGAGFYVNRILALYVNETAQILLEGHGVDTIDRALLNFGFPVGPFKLLDEVGIDVGSKIAPILESELGERFKAPDAFSKLIADGRLGKKSKKGFYDYGKKSKGKQVDLSVYGVLGMQPTATTNASAVAERAALQMLNEAARCLEEGIIASPRDGDIGAIFGIGFPPFLGGPFRYMDTLGAKHVVHTLNGLKETHGERFTPCDLLQRMAENDEKFYQ